LPPLYECGGKPLFLTCSFFDTVFTIFAPFRDKKLPFAPMKFLRPLLAIVLLAILIGAVWLWWALPSTVDMADYAPADSLVYVEFNNPAALAQAIQSTDAWQAATPITQSKASSPNRFMRTAARAGIGPLEAVLFARAQVALVVVGMNTSEEADTLKVKPEVALIAETHTSKSRTKSAAVEVVTKLANFAYGASMCSERTGDADYVECSVAGGERKILGAIEGTLVIIGNSDNAVRSCLEARRGTRPNLRTDTEFLKMRSNLSSDKTLGFGYISPANSAKLFSWAAPLLMDQTLVDQQFQQLIAVSAGKILRGVAWTTSISKGRIEDRYLFSLDPGVVSRLQPAFEKATDSENSSTIDIWNRVPEGFQSLTMYRKPPATSFSSLNSAVAVKLDTLPAVLFGSVLQSSLKVYGLSNPREALTTLNPPLLTLKASEKAEGSILVARVNDEAKLRGLLSQGFVKEGKGEILEGLSSSPNPEKEFTAVFADGYVLLGSSENMRAGLQALRAKEHADAKKYLNWPADWNSAAILTFANDEDRLNSFIVTLLQLQGRRLSNDELASLRSAVEKAPYSTTETRLNSFGIERVTRSGFGQFSTVTSLFQSDTAARQ